MTEWYGSNLEHEGFQTLSVLTIPVYNSDKQILGVTQMINKVRNGILLSLNSHYTVEHSGFKV